MGICLQTIDFTNIRLLFMNLRLTSTQTDPEAWNDTSGSLVCFEQTLEEHYCDSIPEMLYKLNWPSLQTKKQSRLNFLFKIVNKQISIPDQ